MPQKLCCTLRLKMTEMDLATNIEMYIYAVPASDHQNMPLLVVNFKDPPKCDFLCLRNTD